MLNEIQKELSSLERTQNIRILYAVESGSRAWGFASKNSDWDVRFIYINHPDWYLSIDDQKDNVETILPNDLDLAGWDLKKTLKLFRKGNPALLEWLSSPIIYREEPYGLANTLRQLTAEYFNPKGCMFHYTNMAAGNWDAYFKGDDVRIKKYFYVLRPLLAARWVQNNRTMAPMEFHKILKAENLPVTVCAAIDNLLVRKTAGEELDVEKRIPVIDDFIEEKFEQIREFLKEYDCTVQTSTEQLNNIFRHTLKEAWAD